MLSQNTDIMLLLLFLWMFYFGLHSLLADHGIKTRILSHYPQLASFYRFFYTLFAGGSILPLFWYQCYVLNTGYMWQLEGLSKGVCIGLAIIGGLIMAYSIWQYSLSEFIGIDQLSGKTKNDMPTLITTGLSGIVRHPLYLGMLLLATSLVFLFPNSPNWIFLFVLIAYLLIGIPLEEKKLIRIFGEKYITYKQRVKTLIPFIW